MNILGYYETEEIWVPDPILQQQSRSQRLNQYKVKEMQPDKNDYSISSNITNQLFGGTPQMTRTDFGGGDKKNLSQMRKSMKIRGSDVKLALNDTKITTSAESIDEDEDDDQMWNNNGGTGDLLLDFEAKNAIIHVSKDGQFDRYLFDIFVSLESKDDEKMIIEIYKRKDYNSLLQDIREALELKYEELKGLQGLKVKDMILKKRINDVNATVVGIDTSIMANRSEINSSTNNMSYLKGQTKIDIDNRELLVKNQLKDQDHIIVNIDS